MRAALTLLVVLVTVGLAACAPAGGEGREASGVGPAGIVADDVSTSSTTIPTSTTAPTTIPPTTVPSTTTTTDPPPEFPRFEPSEYGALVDAQVPAGTIVPSPPPHITGNLWADGRIHVLAERRGYRPRPVANVSMVAAGGVWVHPDVAPDLRALLDEARSLGLVLEITSGHRSPDRQREIFLRELGEESHRLRGRQVTHDEIAAGDADDVVDAALAYHSIPGYSRHHSGFTVDFDAGGPLAAFEGSPAEVWLRADDFAVAKRHGFVPSYPRGSAPQGPQPEPWEYVYVGAGTVRCAALHVHMQDPSALRSCPLTW